MDRSPDREQWSQRALRGLLRYCSVTALELGYSAKNQAEWRDTFDRPLVSWMTLEFATTRSENRALEVQGLLAERGQHRAPSIPDLLIAAIAETAGLTVLHVDKDFDLIAEVTHQPVERLALAE